MAAEAAKTERKKLVTSDDESFAGGCSYLNIELLVYFLQMLSPSHSPFHCHLPSSSPSFLPSLSLSLFLPLLCKRFI